MTKVIIVRGIVGSGKTRYLSSLAHADGVELIACCADDFFTKDGDDYLESFNPAQLGEAHTFCFDHFVKACDASSGWSQDFVIGVANTNACLFEMSPYIMYAQLRGLPIEIHEVSVPEATPEEYHEFNTHGVPLGAIEGMVARWEKSLPFWPPVTRVETLRAEDKFGIVGDKENSYARMIPAV